MSTPETIDFQPVELANLPPHEVATTVIRHAADFGASDLFLLSEESSLKIGVRNQGRFEQLVVVSKEQGRHLLNYFKSVAAIDIAESTAGRKRDAGFTNRKAAASICGSM